MLGVLEPKFSQYAIDWYINPAIDQRSQFAGEQWSAVYEYVSRGLILFVLAFFGVKLFRCSSLTYKPYC